MTHSTEWQDTRQLDPRDGPSGEGADTAARTKDQAESTADGDFAHTVPLQREDLDPRWWSEAADGQCSEEAAQFAASQPAPLSIV